MNWNTLSNYLWPLWRTMQEKEDTLSDMVKAVMSFKFESANPKDHLAQNKICIQIS